MAKLTANFFDTLQSISVAPREVFLIELEEGDLIYNKHQSFVGPGLAIADRCFVTDDGSVHAHGQIRQYVSGLPDTEVTSNYKLFVQNNKLRNLCERRGATKVVVPGGLDQIISRKGFIMVADFCIFGTKWFELPIEVARKLDLEKYGLKKAVEEYDSVWD